VAVTFDDGYRDTYTQAVPILRQYGIPATVFLAVGAIESGQAPWYDKIFLALKAYPGEELKVHLDQPRRFLLMAPGARLHAASQIMLWLRKQPTAKRREFCAELEARIALPQHELSGRMMTWEQVREMQEAGISFGAHTLTHPPVSRLTEDEVGPELLHSKQILEQRLGRPAPDFAYPFGQPADCGNTADWLKRCGYRSAVTTVPGLNRAGSDLYSLRRFYMEEVHCVSLFALRLSRAFFVMENGPVNAVTNTLSSPMRSSYA
jgi:hypothetical protein